MPIKEEQQWCYYISYKIGGETVYLYLHICLMDRWDTACKTMKKLERSHIYSVSNLPNGYTFRCMANDPVRKICEKNGGFPERKHYFTIPLAVWERKKEQITASFRLQLKQIRIVLCW